jgi:hypothetical protein
VSLATTDTDGNFISTDSGESWNKLTTEWPNEYAPFALAVSE